MKTLKTKLPKMLGLGDRYIEDIPTLELQFIFCEYPGLVILNDILDELIMRGELERMDLRGVTNRSAYEEEEPYFDRWEYDFEFADDDEFNAIDDKDSELLMNGSLDRYREHEICDECRRGLEAVLAGKAITDVPNSVLNWVRGEDWFVDTYEELAEEIWNELNRRKISIDGPEKAQIMGMGEPEGFNQP